MEMTQADIELILRAHPDVPVVVDEAYVDFGARSAVPLMARYPNLVVVHTLSKSRALAGLRVGYALGSIELVEGLRRIKDSFNSYPLDRLAQAGAVAAIEDLEHFEQGRRAVIQAREELSRSLAAMGFEVLPSRANFVFARHPGRDAAQLAAALREQRILVRHFKTPRIEQFLRISVGTPEDCERLCSVLAGILTAR
jgi:histidinol-phosphate aminotransferase